MKLLITGASGYLGSFLVEFFSHHEIIPVYFSNYLDRGVRIDMTDSDCIQQVNSIDPDLIINCAGLKDVGKCEQEPVLAKQINTGIVENIIKCRSRIVQVSTDYVFDGEKGNYDEESRAQPGTVYGRTKLAAEKLALGAGALVVRSSALYSRGGSNFLSFILGQLDKSEKTGYFSNVYNSPTYLGDFARTLGVLIEKNEKGLYHVSGPDRMNKHDFALGAAQEFGYNEDLVADETIGDNSRFPHDLSLNVKKVEKISGSMMSVKDGLKASKSSN